MEQVIIVGTGDYAEAAFFLMRESGNFNVIAFSEERDYRNREKLFNLQIVDLEDLPQLYPQQQVKILVAIGPNRVNTVRERIFLMLRSIGYRFITFIHPTAYVWDPAAIGENSFVFPQVVIEPYATVGMNSVVWSGCVIAHHVSVKDHCFLAPGSKISGRAVIENNCFLGINSTVRDNLVIQSKCIIGAGAIIKKSTEPNGVYSADATLKLNNNSFGTKV